MTAEQRKLSIAGAAYLALGLLISSFFGTWADEEYTLAATGNGIPYAVARALNYELQAPLYFALLAGWRELDGSVWFARLFSLLCATAFFFAVAEIGRRIAPKTDPLPFALLVALNPFVVFAAFEIRLYALALLICALLWLCYDAGFANGASTRARVGFVVLAVAGTYVQYFIAFLLVGFGAGLAAGGRFRSLVSYLAWMCVAVAAIVPLVFLARSQASFAVGPELSRPAILYLTLLHPWLEFFFPHPYGLQESVLEHAGYVALALSMALCWLWSRPRMSPALVSIAAVAVAVEAIYVAAAVGYGEQLSDRYFIALFVPVAAAAYAFERASSARPPIPQRLAVAVIAAMSALSLVTHYRYLAQNGDWKRVADYLHAHALAGDVIAIYPSDSMPAFERQYGHGAARVVPFPRPNPTDRYVAGAVDVASEEQALAALTGLEPYRRLWLVDAVRCPKDRPEDGCDHLLDALASAYTTLESRPFYMNRIDELTRRPDRTSEAGKTR